MRMPKRDKNFKGDDECASPPKKIANNTKRPSIAIASSLSIKGIEKTNDDSKPTQGLRKTNHGVIFQLKLLMLFLIRGINAGYMFKLGTEMEDIGGKFDDLIFKYEVNNDSATEEKRYRYRYLQAKHKQNSQLKITTKQLFNDSEGDFSLPKYFRSYCDMISRGDDVEDCIICTNISFNENDLKNNQIKLEPVEEQDRIFAFGTNSTIPVTRCRMKINPDNKYYKILQTNNSSNPGQSNANDPNKNNKEIDDFFQKLVFIVNTPNEVDLGKIISEDISEYYKLHESDFQSDFILRNMLDWFKEKESTFLSSQKGKEILHKGKEKMKSLRMTAVSIDYQKEIKENLDFNPKAVHEMAKKLRLLLTSSNMINHILSPLPKHTAVKIIAALKELRQIKSANAQVEPEESKYFRRIDNYLITPFKQLERKWGEFKQTMESTLVSHNLLIVVCEDGSSETEISDKTSYTEMVKNTSKKIIFITNGNCEGVQEIKDDIKFVDLSYQSKKRLLLKVVPFQEVLQTVGTLIKQNDESVHELIKYGSPEDVIDFSSMKELTEEIEKVKFPSYSALGCQPLLCIERQMSFDDKLAKRIGCKIKIKSDNRVNMEKAIEEERKLKIWEEFDGDWDIKSLLVDGRNNWNSKSSIISNCIVSENDLIEEENWNKQLFIISGVAGTGKSTVLSYYYNQIKKEKPDHWVIRMNLVDYLKSLPQLDSKQIDQLNGIEFLKNHLPNVKNSRFAQSLLNYRIKNGDRIVIMLDGFDEIDTQRQNKVIDLIKSLRLTELNALYITTRSHCNEKLEKPLNHFSFTLENFSRDDQINFLTNYWENKFGMPSTTMRDDGPLRRFVESLVDRLSKTLKDKERAFIGIPLQCQILAECFESQLSKDNIEKGLNVDSLLQDVDANMNLESLYRQLMKKKREIYRQEKIKSKSHNPLVDTHIEDDMKHLKSYLTKLALKTIVSKQEDLDILLGKKRSFQSELKLEKKRQKRNDYGVRFGLLNNTNEQGKMQFLHRTYAEYLMAKYLYQGFHLDEKRHNKLLDEESVRHLIAGEILVNPQYNGVLVFFDSMMKAIVHSEKWSNIVHQGLSKDIPIRLKSFAGGFCSQTNFLYRSKNALCVALKQENGTIFNFLNDCLDLLVDKSEVQQMMKSLLDSCTDLFHHLYMQSSEQFQRYLSYFDDTDDNDLKNILSSLCKCLPPHEMDYLYWNREEQRKIVTIWLELMMKHREFLTQRILSEKKQTSDKWLKFRWVFIVRFFIVNEYYENQLTLFLELLSCIYDDENSLVNVIEGVFTAPENHHLKGKTGKTLTILKNLGRHDVLMELSSPVLMLDPQALQNIYPLCLPEEEETEEQLPNDDETVRLLVPHQKPDGNIYSNMISPLHQAAFQGNTKALERLLDIVRKNLSHHPGSNPKNEEVVTQVLGCMMMQHDGKSFTPFYLAAACGHEEVCCQLLLFMKEILTDEKLKQALFAEKGLLHSVLRDAIKYKKLETFQLILKSIQRSMGQFHLLELLKSKVTTGNDNRKMNPPSSFISACKSKLFLDQIIQIVTQESSEGYDDLNDLVFQDEKTIESIRAFDADTLYKMFATKGLDAWIRRLLDMDITKGFNLMSACLLDKMNRDQILQFIETITSIRLTNDDSKINHGSSYWAEYITNDNLFKRCDKLMEILLEKLDTNTIKELVLHDDGKVVTRAVLNNKKPIVDFLLVHLPKHDQHEIGQRVVQTASHVMKEALNSSEHKSTSFRNFSLIFNFIINHANNSQLLKFVEDIMVLHKTEGENLKSSIWGHFIQENDNDDNVDNFLKCVSERLGENFVKNLAIHDDGRGAVIFRAELRGKSQMVESMLSHLSKEGRNEIDQFTASFGSKLIEDYFFSSTPTYWTMLDNYSGINILMFFVSFGNSTQLAEFVKVLTSVTEINGKERSIWNHLPELCLKEQEMLRFKNSNSPFIYVSKKTDDLHILFECVSNQLGENVLKELVLNDNGIVIIRLALLCERSSFITEDFLDHFSEENQIEVGKHLAEHLPQTLKNALIDLGPLHKLRLLNILHLVDYTSGSQLLQFIDVITSVHNLLGKNCSIFRNFFNHDRNYYVPHRLCKINRFMKCVSEKLKMIDENAWKRLVYHDEGDGPVILRVAEKGEKLIENVIAHLKEEDKEEVERFLCSRQTY